MKRLFWRLYLTVLASLVLFVVLVALVFKMTETSDWKDWTEQRVRLISTLVSDALPPGISGPEAEQRLDAWYQEFAMAATLYDSAGQAVASGGRSLPLPDKDRRRSDHGGHDHESGSASNFDRYWVNIDGQSLILLPLGQGRTLVTVAGKNYGGGGGPGRGFAAVLGILALIGVAVAVMVFPSARRIARRFEGLQTSVDQFGAGDLSARAEVKGRDEAAALATAFNRSADRIEALLKSQKSLLANASHELRSPLARIRMAVSLFNEPHLDAIAREQAGRELQRNVAELDELVDELLTASRLDAGQGAEASRQAWESFDLAGLVAEECARTDISPDLISIEFEGDRRLLRRLIRNLLENALRYGLVGVGGTDAGAEEAIAVNLQTVRDDQGVAQISLSVCDRGPGIPADEAERIFEPFYRARGASEKAGGVGLGLSLVRQIARHHRGSVRCTARHGGGTCFEVYLPL